MWRCKAMEEIELSNVEGSVFNIVRFSIRDGPGIRTTVFFKGCPLYCKWCHNPEGLSSRPQIMFLQDMCIGCELCISSCPTGAAESYFGGSNDNFNKCLGCGACVQVCPTLARELSGQKMLASEVLDEVLKDRLFYEESGGGVSFSGGEPLMQPDFLESCLRLCREKHLHTVLDTCGYAPREHLKRMIPFVSLFLYDLKMVDSNKHNMFTGVGNKLILDNLKYLDDKNAEIVIRIPIIPDVNDDIENAHNTGKFLSQLKTNHLVHLLPMHNTAIGKYNSLGKLYDFSDKQGPENCIMKNFSKIIESYGLVTLIGG